MGLQSDLEATFMLDDTGKETGNVIKFTCDFRKLVPRPAYVRMIQVLPPHVYRGPGNGPSSAVGGVAE